MSESDNLWLQLQLIQKGRVIERVTGFEPVNISLGSSCLTTWRHPRTNLAKIGGLVPYVSVTLKKGLLPYYNTKGLI